LGEKRRKSLKSNPASNRLCGIICERRSLVIKGREKMNGILMCNSRRRVKKNSKGWCLMAKVSSRKLAEQTKSLRQRGG